MLDILNTRRSVTLTEVGIETLVSRVEVEVECLRYLAYPYRFHGVIEDVIGTLLMLFGITWSTMVSPKGSVSCSLIC